MRGFTIEILLTGIPNALAKCQKISKNVNLGLFIEILGRLGSNFSYENGKMRTKIINTQNVQS